MARLCNFLDDRFRPYAGPRLPQLTAAALTGAVPHHNFHVFCVSPWVGLLRAGRVEEPLRVLDRCRIRWGTVIAVKGGTAVVRSHGLVWDGWTVRPGPLRTERATVATDGLAALRHHTSRAVAAAAPLTG